MLPKFFRRFLYKGSWGWQLKILSGGEVEGFAPRMCQERSGKPNLKLALLTFVVNPQESSLNPSKPKGGSKS